MTHLNSPLRKASTGVVGALAIASGTHAYGNVVSATLPADILPGTFPTSGTSSVNWDVNNDGIVDFSFSFRQPQSTGVDWQANMFALSNTAILSYAGASFYYANRLTAGQAVAAGGPNAFYPGSASGVQVIIGSRFAGTNYGQFQPPNSTGFIGFRFTVAGSTFNGYIQLKAARSFGIDFISAAYNNTPNGAITAGQAPIPEPGTLGLLAIGAAGIGSVIAKRRKAAATA